MTIHQPSDCFYGFDAVNHALFWQTMAPNTAGSIPEPEGALRAAIDQQFGSFQDFTKAFTNAALKLFGSGWTWLYFDTTSGQLALTSTQNQDTPAMVATRIPLLGLDVWEHVRRLIVSVLNVYTHASSLRCWHLFSGLLSQVSEQAGRIHSPVVVRVPSYASMSSRAVS